ncbi:ChaC-like protein-domain-containing protein [Gilbertella persicaria]|uniref:ChaC-like protein-domain-containing protein n=1 Tax=Gilbertella persicaria TaxID=101096 RepID=UPI00221F842C|nr:ChaC-like protein-domain-containing protein [Gilbertella persicaria]KAI8084336.1 ChaC-like protein-domain-containing protein [Gilbertella persicaria]
MSPTIQKIDRTVQDIKNVQKEHLTEENTVKKQYQDGIWVFGYGSLIWKPPIHYEAKQIGYIKNYVRRFWQEGHDTVTWGVAFKIPSDDVEATRAYLDHREKATVKNALVYIGTTDNEAYVGPAPYEAIAQQIHDTYGPSGWNAEYLLNLAEALREISPGVRDDHVFELEARVRKLIDDSQKDSKN